MAAAAADVRGVRAAAGADAAGGAVRAAGVPVAHHRHGDVCHGEDAAAVESGEFSTGQRPSHVHRLWVTEASQCRRNLIGTEPTRYFIIQS